MEKMSAVTTEEQFYKSVIRSYVRKRVLLGIWLSELLVLIGASLLFSLVHQVDWRICASFSIIILLSAVVLLLFFLARTYARSPQPSDTLDKVEESR